MPIPWKLSLLERAFRRFQETDPINLREDFAVFRAENSNWIEDYALFMALKNRMGVDPGWIGLLQFASEMNSIGGSA